MFGILTKLTPKLKAYRALSAKRFCVHVLVINVFIVKVWRKALAYFLQAVS